MLFNHENDLPRLSKYQQQFVDLFITTPIQCSPFDDNLLVLIKANVGGLGLAKGLSLLIWKILSFDLYKSIPNTCL